MPTTTVAPPPDSVTVASTPSLHANAVPLNHEIPAEPPKVEAAEPPKPAVPDPQNVYTVFEAPKAEQNTQQAPPPPVQINELPKEVPVDIPTTTTPAPQEVPPVVKPVAQVDPIPITTEPPKPVIEETGAPIPPHKTDNTVS